MEAIKQKKNEIEEKLLFREKLILSRELDQQAARVQAEHIRLEKDQLKLKMIQYK